MTTYNPNPTYPSSHPGNMTMYSNQVLSAGLHSEISSLHSLSPLNYVGMPPAGDRNEMLFMPPIDGQLDNLGSNLMTNPVSGDQNFECQGLSLSLGTHMTSAHPSFSSSFMGMNVPPDSRWGKCEAMRNFGMNQYERMGFANAIVKSKYLKAAQQLLDEVVNVLTAIKQRDSDKDQCSHRSDGRSSCVQSNVTESIANSSSEPSPAERRDLQNKKERLISMLDEVDRKYRQYCHQMQSLVSSFDTIAGPGSAKTYMKLALQAISRQFRSVRDAINGQIQATRKSLGEPDTSSNGGAIPRLRFVDHQLRQQKALQQLGVMRHAWRPQRGLPENSVSILRAWLFEHFLHPYPNDSEKIMLARQTGLTRNQVANWFINARVRLWKPMVEEMYKEEFGDLEVTSESSPENAPKATNNYNPAATEDTGQDSLNNSTTPANIDAQPEIERESNKPIAKSLFQNGSHGECILHDHRLLYQNENFSPNMNATPELNGFLSGNQVTLALGLQNHKNSAFSLPSDETHMGGGNHRIASSGGNDTGDYHCMDLGNRQDRFSNSHHYMIL